MANNPYTTDLMKNLYWRKRTEGGTKFPNGISFCREFFTQGKEVSSMHERRADHLNRHFHLKELGGSVVVLGAGVGLLNESLTALGITDNAGLDNGPFLDDLDLSKEVRHPAFYQLDLFDPPERQYDWVITEDVAPSYKGEELEAFFLACEQHLAPGRKPERIIHIVSPLRDRPGDSALNWLAENQWRAMAPSHSFTFTPLR
jgi:hypothetical protein